MSFRLWTRALALTVMVVATGFIVAPAAMSSAGDAPRRGFEGLRPGGPGTACLHGFVVERTGTCTHGPDDMPSGVDLGALPSIAELREAATDASGDAASSGVPCIGDGVSGPRVQAIYVRASDTADRYAEVAPLIERWAGAVDDTFADSAAATGGVRHVRWVTESDCGLSVANVVVSATADEDFGATISEVRAKGFGRSDRKYLIWADAGVYCGIGEFSSDDRAGSTNSNNFGPNYARVDAPCWGRADSTEAHELMHTFGGVQFSAPHSNGAGHCSEDYDRMCYRETSTAPMVYRCAVDHERLFDCGHDDYFHTSPPAGSYLATHWNAASSVFLSSDAGGSEPPPPSSSETSPTTSTWSDSVGRKAAQRSYLVTMGAGDATAQLSTGKRGTLTLELRDASGTVLATASGSGTVRVAATVAPGEHTWVVSGSGGYTLTVTYPAP